MRTLLVSILLCSVVFCSGCVNRKITFLSEPSGAEVFFDGELIGKTPVTVKFTYYGKHAVLLHLDKYEIVNGEVDIQSPWHQKPGLDFFSENVYPFSIIDEQTVSFELKPVKRQNTEEAIRKARELKIEYEKFLNKRGTK